MKFLCGNCKAKYQIADDKVQGRTLRMTCRQCKKEIIIQGPPTSIISESRQLRPRHSQPIPMPLSALAADFRRQIAVPPRERPAPRVAPQWHVAINDIPVGPMRLEEVSRKIAVGAVHEDSLVWREGLDDWIPAIQAPEIAALLVPTQLRGVGQPGSMYEQQYPGAAARSTYVEPPRASAQIAAMPIGGRLGADVPAAVEQFIPMAPPPETAPVSTVGPFPAAMPARSPFAAWGPMFVMVCGATLVLTLGMVLGVKFLGASERLERVTTVEKAAPTPAAESRREESSGGIVALDMQEIDGKLGERAGAKGRTAQSTDSKDVAAKGGKELSEQEKEMLARMGGGFDRTPSTGLRTAGASSGSSSGLVGGGLKAEQLSAVVSRGKMELQRCYESALRLNPSKDTIRLDVDITVGLSGAVTAVKTRGTALGDMDSCIIRTVRMWRFPTAGEETRTTFPVVFQPGA